MQTVCTAFAKERSLIARFVLLPMVVACALGLGSPRLPAAKLAFLRGDAFGDGGLDISDCIAILDTLFFGIDPAACDDAADVNDEGTHAELQRLTRPPLV